MAAPVEAVALVAVSCSSDSGCMGEALDLVLRALSAPVCLEHGSGHAQDQISAGYYCCRKKQQS